MSEIDEGLKAELQPAEPAKETAPEPPKAETVAAPEPAAPPTAPPAMSSDRAMAEYMAMQNQQLQQQLQWQQMQMAQSQPHPKAEAEEPLPDATLEPEKYSNALFDKRMRQFMPLFEKQQMELAQVKALSLHEAVKKELSPEALKYERIVLELAGQSDPRLLAENPNAWKGLYSAAIGWEQLTPKQQAEAQKAAADPSAPAGQWPGAKQPPAPVSQPGHGQTQSPKVARQWSDEHLKVAAIVGLPPEEVFKEEK